MKELAVVISNDNENVSPYETIDAIASSGFKNVFVQWYENDYKSFDVSQEEQVRYARSKGLKVIFAHLGYRNMNDIWLDGEVGEAWVKRYLKNLDELKDLGIDMVIMHACVGFDAPKTNRIGLERFRRICNRARELNIKVAFENTKMPGYLEYLLDHIDYDNVGVCYDCGHDHCHFKDHFDFEHFRDKIFAIHIHDNHGEKDEHLLPGDGSVNYDYVLDGLSIANYHSYLTFELCYRNEYLNENIEDFYKKGYNLGMRLKKKYEEEYQ